MTHPIGGTAMITQIVTTNKNRNKQINLNQSHARYLLNHTSDSKFSDLGNRQIAIINPTKKMMPKMINSNVIIQYF